MVRLRRRVRLAWHRRRPPRWADRWHIIVYVIGRFIAPGAMVLGLIVPLAPHQVLPVVGVSVWVVVCETSEYVAPL